MVNWVLRTMAKDERASAQPRRGTCGDLTDLAERDGVKISRCNCGVVHLNVVAAGLTLRLSAEQFRSLAGAAGDAQRVIDENASAEAVSAIH